MSADSFEVDCSADHGGQRLVLDLAGRKVELCVAQIADTRSEAEAQQMHEGEDVISEARRIGVVLFDPQIRFMVKQAVEDIGGVAYPDVDDFGAEGRVLIRDVGVEEFARFGSILGIDVAGALGLASGLESLPVR